MSSTVQVKTRIIVKTFRSHECNEGRENSIRLRFPIEIPKSNRDAFLLPCTSSISSLQRFLRRRGRNQRAYLRNINAGWLETRRVSARERCTYVCMYVHTCTQVAAAAAGRKWRQQRGTRRSRGNKSAQSYDNNRYTLPT